MNTAIAKILAATVIVIALLGGMILLVVYKAPSEAIAGVSTAFGIAVAAVVPMVTGKDNKGPPGVVAVLLASGLALAGESSCASPQLPEPTIEQKHTAAKTKYGEQLLKCVDDYSTPATIDACADDVRRRWGKDGGTQ